MFVAAMLAGCTLSPHGKVVYHSHVEIVSLELRVLTMEYLEGAALTDLETIKRTTRADPEQTLIAALNTWTGSLIAAETFHADVHAGIVVCRHCPVDIVQQALHM